MSAPTAEQRQSARLLGTIEGEPIEDCQGFPFVRHRDERVHVGFCWACHRYSSGAMYTIGSVWIGGPAPLLPGNYCAPCWTLAANATEAVQ
jgi:hypothetical protein